MTLLKPNIDDYDYLTRKGLDSNTKIMLSDVFNVVDLNRHKVEIELTKNAANDLLNYFLTMPANPENENMQQQTRVIVTIFFTPVDQANEANLSERELTILQMIANGRTTTEISTELFLSEGTVKREVRHIFDKLNVHNRSEAVAEALKRNLITNG